MISFNKKIKFLLANGIAIFSPMLAQKAFISGAHSDMMNALAFLGNGNLVSGCFDGTIKIWNSNTGALIKTLNTTNAAGIWDLAVLKTGELVSSDLNGLLRFWDVNTGTLIKTIQGNGWNSLAVLNNNQLVTGSSTDTSINIWS